MAVPERVHLTVATMWLTSLAGVRRMGKLSNDLHQTSFKNVTGLRQHNSVSPSFYLIISFSPLVLLVFLFVDYFIRTFWSQVTFICNPLMSTPQIYQIVFMFLDVPVFTIKSHHFGSIHDYEHYYSHQCNKKLLENQIKFCFLVFSRTPVIRIKSDLFRTSYTYTNYIFWCSVWFHPMSDWYISWCFVTI